VSSDSQSAIAMCVATRDWKLQQIYGDQGISEPVQNRPALKRHRGQRNEAEVGIRWPSRNRSLDTSQPRFPNVGTGARVDAVCQPLDVKDRGLVSRLSLSRAVTADRVASTRSLPATNTFPHFHSAASCVSTPKHLSLCVHAPRHTSSPFFRPKSYSPLKT